MKNFEDNRQLENLKNGKILSEFDKNNKKTNIDGLKNENVIYNRPSKRLILYFKGISFKIKSQKNLPEPKYTLKKYEIPRISPEIELNMFPKINKKTELITRKLGNSYLFSKNTQNKQKNIEKSFEISKNYENNKNFVKITNYDDVQNSYFQNDDFKDNENEKNNDNSIENFENYKENLNSQEKKICDSFLNNKDQKRKKEDEDFYKYLQNDFCNFSFTKMNFPLKKSKFLDKYILNKTVFKNSTKFMKKIKPYSKKNLKLQSSLSLEKDLPLFPSKLSSLENRNFANFFKTKKNLKDFKKTHKTTFSDHFHQLNW